MIGSKRFSATVSVVVDVVVDVVVVVEVDSVVLVDVEMVVSKSVSVEYSVVEVELESKSIS